MTGLCLALANLKPGTGKTTSAVWLAHVIPCAPSPIEINRTTPVRDEIAEVGSVHDRPARSVVLLNRCITRAHSISDARQALQELGYEVLATVVPRLEVYAQSFGLPSPTLAATCGARWPAS
jgi:cellulose biosynthesis protein BcsQ